MSNFPILLQAAVSYMSVSYWRGLTVISQQELRIHICSTLSINIVNTCFDHRYSTAILQTEV